MSIALMHYIQTQPPRGGADKYHGAIARGYDKKREDSPKWTIEQRIIEEMLDDLPRGDWVLDCPVGTGRFIPFYEKKGLLFLGVDKSDDMIGQAAMKVATPQRARFSVGDVRGLPCEDKSADAAVMCRLTRWLSPDDCQVALKELQRVARKKIISTWRVRNHPHARSYELIQGALDGWVIHRDEAGADMDYRIIEMRPA